MIISPVQCSSGDVYAMAQNDTTKKQVIDICDGLFEKGFLAVTGGNISVRLGSRMYTGMADTAEVIDDALNCFEVVLGSVEGV
jgi:ribulose-5-phosphate 4-epimerase/fuculose-1-phosphate aldolase